MRNAENSMNKNFRIALQYDPDGYWIAEHPELPGCKADGETPQEALSSLEIARDLWIESRLATGLDVPEPQEVPQYSGRFVLRIAKSMHRELAQEAEAEGISLNSFVGQVLAGRHVQNGGIVSYAHIASSGCLESTFPEFHPRTSEGNKAPTSSLFAIPGRQSAQTGSYLGKVLDNDQFPKGVRQYA
jgi:predicted RNase H-like HicB family nuclease